MFEQSLAQAYFGLVCCAVEIMGAPEQFSLLWCYTDVIGAAG